MDLLDPLPEAIEVHLDRGYDSGKTCIELAERGLTAQTARRGRLRREAPTI